MGRAAVIGGLSVDHELKRALVETRDPEKKRAKNRQKRGRKRGSVVKTEKRT